MLCHILCELHACIAIPVYRRTDNVAHPCTQHFHSPIHVSCIFSLSACLSPLTQSRFLVRGTTPTRWAPPTWLEGPLQNRLDAFMSHSTAIYPGQTPLQYDPEPQQMTAARARDRVEAARREREIKSAELREPKWAVASRQIPKLSRTAQQREQKEEKGDETAPPTQRQNVSREQMFSQLPTASLFCSVLSPLASVVFHEIWVTWFWCLSQVHCVSRNMKFAFLMSTLSRVPSPFQRAPPVEWTQPPVVLTKPRARFEPGGADSVLHPW